MALLAAGAAAGSDGGPTAPPASTVYATATVEARPLDTATAAVTIIDRAMIEAAGAVTVGELLRFVPGVNVTGEGLRGGINTVQIRGGDPNFTLVLLDGVPLNDPTYQIGDVFNLEGLSTAAIERIEIVRGPLSSHYGSTGLAGAVHIFTRRSVGEGVHGEVEGEGGDADHQRVRAALGGGGAGHGYFVDLGGEREAGRIADERFEALHLQGRAELALGARSDLQLGGRLASWEGDDYPEASGGPFLGSGELRRADNQELSFGAELRTGRGTARRHRLDLAVYRHDLERQSPAIGFQVPASEETTRFTRSRLGWAFTYTPRPAFQLSLGATVEREEGENQSLLLLPPAFGGAVAGDYRQVRTTPGVYGELVAHRGDFTFEMGVRVDLPEEISAETSPRLGLRWQPGGGATRLRASVGRAFKLPSFFALASPPQLGGNPDLEPEEMVGADLGVEHTFAAAKVEAGLGVFAHRYSNLVDFDFATFSHVNRGEVEAVGAELFLRWQPRAAWRVALDLTGQEVEDTGSGAPLLHRPDWHGGLRLDWRPRPALALHLDGSWVSGFRDQQIPVPARQRVAGHQLWGASAAWRFAPRLWLRARVDNLTDEAYEPRIGFPGAGRAWRLGLRWSAGGRP